MFSAIANLPVPGAPAFTPAALVLVAWVPMAVVAFRLLPPVRALVGSYLGAWMFLPFAALPTPFVVYDKAVATSVGVLLAVVIARPAVLGRYRFRWIDWPMLLWCLVPAAAAMSNANSPYDVAAAAAKQTLTWGLPYFLGRCLLTDLAAAREMALGLFVGGLVYVPFCLAEVRLSPFLHYAVYRVWQHEDILQAFRDGGFRPMVFMQHGLAVALFMSTAALMGWWLWWTGALRSLWRVPALTLTLAVMVTVILCKSTGALALMVGSAALLHFVQKTRIRLVMVAVMLIPVGWVAARTVGGWKADNAIQLAREVYGPERAQSFEFRVEHENAYLDHDRLRPWLGYGPGYTFMVFDDYGKVLVVDSLWIITLSVNGAIGLVLLLVVSILPSAVLLWRIPVRHFGHPAYAGALGCIGAVMLFATDNLSNAMFNPCFVLALGCVGCLATAPLALPVAPLVQRSARRPARRGFAVVVPQPTGPAEFEPGFLASDTLSLDEGRG